MKYRYVSLIALMMLVSTAAAYAAPPAAVEAQEPAVERVAAPAPEEASPDVVATCADAALVPLVADPLADLVTGNHCGDGFDVSSCEECPQFSCTCSPFNLCCYC